MKAEELLVGRCGDGISCNGESSNDVSSCEYVSIIHASTLSMNLYVILHLPIVLWGQELSTLSLLPAAFADGPMSNSTDPETIHQNHLLSRLAEPYMIEKYENDEEFWTKYDVQPSWMLAYFGSHNGLFLKIPDTDLTSRTKNSVGAMTLENDLGL